MKKIIITVLFIIVFVNLGIGQLQIQWRAEASSGEWVVGDNSCSDIGQANSQWWYPGWDPNNARNAPNCFGVHSLGINNNHELNMNNSVPFIKIHGIVFNTGASSPRTISGEGIDLDFSSTGPKIINLSSATHTINNNLAINTNPCEINPVNGNLILTGEIYTNGNYIDIYGSNQKIVSFTADITGAGGIALKQNSTVVFQNNKLFSGGTSVEAGTLELQASIANSDVTVASGATLRINGTNVTVKSLTVNAGGNVEIEPGKSLTIIIRSSCGRHDPA